jgi:hypothetical protein
MVGEKSVPEIEDFDTYRCVNCGTVIVYEESFLKRKDESKRLS